MVAPVLIQLGVTGGIMLGRYIYHRLNPDPPPRPQQFTRTKVEEGRPVSLAFGRCMVRNPVQVWVGEQRARFDPGGLDGATYWQGAPYLYDYEAFFTICIPFGAGTHHVWSIYAGDVRIPDGDEADPFAAPGTYTPLRNLTGNGSFEADTSPCFVWAHHSDAASKGSAYEIGGLVEFLNGNSAQQLVDGFSAPKTAVATRMIAFGDTPNFISGYRGVLSMFLGSKQSGPSANRWGIGNTPHAQQLSFEVATYPGQYLLPYFIGTQVGDEANPAVVIAAILTDTYGKLGLDISRLDIPSFKLAAETLAAEGHGYSRAFEDRVEAGEMIDDVLRQIDGVLYEEPTTGLIVLKLIRADYDPNALLEVNPSTCDEVSNFAAGGWTSTVNKIRVIFEDRADDYRDNSATAQNMANAVGQDGETREQVLEFRGLKTKDQAEPIAARELGFRSRPLARCRVKVDRTFWNARPGDVVRMVWPKLNIANRVFRIGHASRGTASENVVYLDLIEDYFYVYRGHVSSLPPVAPFPGEILG